MTEFELHPVLTRDTVSVARLPISELLLMNDARFPWCILVPRLADLSEWHHLPREHHPALMAEIEAVSLSLLELPETTKLNVGALGNRVPQLHIHVVARHPGDAAWPDPVWGFGQALAYTDPDQRHLLDHLRASLSG